MSETRKFFQTSEIVCANNVHFRMRMIHKFISHSFYRRGVFGTVIAATRTEEGSSPTAPKRSRMPTRPGWPRRNSWKTKDTFWWSNGNVSWNRIWSRTSTCGTFSTQSRRFQPLWTAAMPWEEVWTFSKNFSKNFFQKITWYVCYCFRKDQRHQASLQMQTGRDHELRRRR